MLMKAVFFKTDNTENKKFDEPIKDEKIVPARIDEPNLFSIGDYVTLKEKTIKEGIAKGFIKNPLGSIFKGDKCFKIVNTSLDTLTAEHTFVFVADDIHFGFTIEVDKANEVIQKLYTGEDEPNNNTPLKTKKTRVKKGETKK